MAGGQSSQYRKFANHGADGGLGEEDTGQGPTKGPPTPLVLGFDAGVIKTVDEPRTNNTIADDADLLLPLGVGHHVVFFWINTDWSAAGDLRFQFSTPTLEAGVSHRSYWAGVNAIDFQEATDWPTIADLTAGAAQTDYIVHGRGNVDVQVAGNLIFRWAQVTADASPAIVKAGSWMMSKLI